MNRFLRQLWVFILAGFIPTLGEAQESKLITIIDGDTVGVNSSGIKVHVIVSGDTLPFHEGEQLQYPRITSNSDIDAFLVSFQGKSLEFFSRTNPLLPPQLAALSGPFYLDLFQDHRNMTVTYYSSYDPFENMMEMEKTAGMEEQKQLPHLSLHYQQEVLLPIK